MQTPVHLSIGQEAVAVALCAQLGNGDLKIGTHRCHGLYLANGGDLTAFFAELLGRSGGCSGGWGGSMHLIDRDHGLVGTTSIVGGALPIAVGLGMAVRRPDIAAVLFGDGAADQGVFAESLNFAVLHRLPVVFVCEHNRYSVYTPTWQRRAVDPSVVAGAFGIETLTASIEVAADVFALDELMREPVAAVRSGAGPLLVECHTVRALDHNGVRDDVAAGFRPQAEKELYAAHDPLVVAREILGDRLARRIDAECAAAVERAYSAALNLPEAVIETPARSGRSSGDE